MQVLLAAATEFEVIPFIKQRPGVDLLVTGVGSPAAIYNLAKRIRQVDYDVVIQAGIAGSFTDTLQLGECVIVAEDVFADLGISEKGQFFSLFDTGLMEESAFPFEKGWLKNDSPFLDTSMRQVTGITVNTVTDNPDVIEQLRMRYNAQVETMEGAALHFVCLQEMVPFIQLRAISNYVGERDKLKWALDPAVANLCNALDEIYRKLAALPQGIPAIKHS